MTRAAQPVWGMHETPAPKLLFDCAGPCWSAVAGPSRNGLLDCRWARDQQYGACRQPHTVAATVAPAVSHRPSRRRSPACPRASRPGSAACNSMNCSAAGSLVHRCGLQCVRRCGPLRRCAELIARRRCNTSDGWTSRRALARCLRSAAMPRRRRWSACLRLRDESQRRPASVFAPAHGRHAAAAAMNAIVSASSAALSPGGKWLSFTTTVRVAGSTWMYWPCSPMAAYASLSPIVHHCSP